MSKKVPLATRRDFRVETMRGSGPGGQKRNKTDSAVRITHVSTGMSEYCCETPSQARNKSTAFRRLARRIVDHYERVEAKERFSAGFERIRTYHAVDDRVVDHRTGQRWSYRDTVGRGDLRAVVEDTALSLVR